MRSYPSCWNKTLTKLGFKRVFKRRLSKRGKPKKLQLGRHSLIEQLEPRQMLAADTYVVSTLEDVSEAGTSTDDQWSLREALVDSANDPTGEPDTIKFAPLLWGGIIELDAALSQLVIDSDVAIQGPGADLLTIDAKGNSRVFKANADNEVTIEGVTITGGLVGSHGGGIYNDAELNLIEVAITGNQTSGTNKHGGGLFSQSGSVEIIDSLISNNHAAKNGGGIFFRAYGDDTLEMYRSTIANNTTGGSGRAGGLMVYAFGPDTSSATLVDTTVSGNQALIGAGIMTNGSPSLTLINSTVTENIVTQDSAGVLNNQHTADVTLFNSIVAGNLGGLESTRDLARGVDASSANNLIGRHYATSIDTLRNEMLNANQSPELLPLGNYGGPVPTHMPTEDSPAKDKGDALHYQSATNAGTQHYLDRVVGASIDIGAHEYGAKPILADKPFAIDTLATSSFQQNPWVATSETGTSVVTWGGNEQEDWGVYYQLINPDGAATSQPRRVDLGDYFLASYMKPRVAIDRAGRFAIAWNEDSSIYLRRYESDGTPIDTLPVLVSSDGSAGSVPSVVSNAEGRLVVTWQAANGDLMFRRYSTSGLSLDSWPNLGELATMVDPNGGTNLRTNLTTPTSGRSVAIGDDGSFYLLWGHDTPDGQRIFMQGYSSGGASSGPEHVVAELDATGLDTEEEPGNITTPNFQVSATLTSTELSPYDFVVDSQGTVSVAWKRAANWELVGGDSFTRGEQRLALKQFNANSGWSSVAEVTQGSEVAYEGLSDGNYVDIGHDLNLDRPGLAVDRLGRLGIAWQQSLSYEVGGTDLTQIWSDADYDATTQLQGQEHEGDIQLRWYEENNLYTNSIVQANQFATGSDQASKPTLASNSAGEFLLIGQVSNQLYAQRYQLTKPIELVEGQLRINDVFSQFKDMTVATAPIEGVGYVTLNGQVTDILASEVISIDITAGADDNRIDLSRVSLNQFPNLVIDGTQGAITIRGGAGDDTIFGTAFDDTILGEDDNDEIFGGEGIDAIFGGEGDDVLQGGEGDDDLQGELGDDRLFGGEGDDTLTGNEGDDRLFGQGGSDILTGNAGKDLLDGGAGVLDELDGGLGDDRFLITQTSAGSVEITDVDGIDEIDLSQTASTYEAALDLSIVNSQQSLFVDPDLPANTLVYLLIGNGTTIENAIGTRNDDQLTGNDAANVLRGGFGDDVLMGEDGADELLGEGGIDTLNPGATPTEEVDLLVGGFGGDVYELSNDVTTTARINDEEGTDKIDLSTWTGTQGATLDLSLTPEDGDYQEIATGVQLSNSGLDQIEDIKGTPNPDTLGGNASDNDLDGNSSHNEIQGNGGSDTITGDAGIPENDAPTFDFTTGNTPDYPASAPLVITNPSQSFANDILFTVVADDTETLAADLEFHGVASNHSEVTIVDNGDGTASVKWPHGSGRPEGNHTITVVVSDDGSPAKETAHSFTVKIGTPPGGPSWNATTVSSGTENNLDDYTITEHNEIELQFSATGNGTLTYSKGSDTPVGLDVNAQTGVLTWTPAEDQDGVHSIEVRVTDSGDPPLRTSKWITVEVLDENTAPTLVGDPTLVNNTGDHTDTTTADATLTGTVTNDEAVDLIEIEVDYSYDGVNFQTDEVVQVEASDIDPTVGTYVIRPDAFDLVIDPNNIQSRRVAVQAREWIDENFGSDGYQRSSTIGEITFTPDPAKHDDPIFTIELSNHTGTNAGETVDPSIQGLVTRPAGKDEEVIGDLNVEYSAAFDDGTGTHTGTVTGSTETDANGTFQFVPEGMFDGLPTSITMLTVIVDATVEKKSPLDDQGSFAKSPLQTITFDLYRQNAPIIETFQIHPDHNTGADDNDTVTSDPWLSGSLKEIDPDYHGTKEGVIIEFSHGATSTDLAGATVTDVDGNFEYLPPGIAEGTPTTVRARAVVWDEYTHTKLVGNWFDFQFTYKKDENEAASISTLKLKHDKGNFDGVVSDPTVEGRITNDGSKEGLLVEWFVVAAGTTSFDPDDTSNPPELVKEKGFAVTDDSGEFEFTPVQLNENTAYDVHARVIEWDGLQAAGLELLTATYSGDKTLTLTKGNLTTDPENVTLQTLTISNAGDPAELVNYQLSYNTGSNATDNLTADPTVQGTVEYEGDMENVVVELRLANNDETIVELTPDEDGSFQYTMPGLADGADIAIEARVLVPDYTAKAPEFDLQTTENEAGRLSDVDGDGILEAGWFVEGYNFETGEWETDPSEQWLEDLFIGDGTELGGEWYHSGFIRDWENLFEDYTTAWKPLDDDTSNDDVDTLYVLNLSEVSVLGVSASFAGVEASDPTITGSLTGEQQLDNLRLEFSLDGGTTYDGEAYTDKDGSYRYTFQNPELDTMATQSITVRVHRLLYGETETTDSVLPAVNITNWNIPSLAGLEVADLRLQNPLYASALPQNMEAIDPTVIGTIAGLGDLALQTVQFEYKPGDNAYAGIVSATALTDGQGNFEFTAENILGLLDTSGDFTLRARLVETRTATDTDGNEYEYLVFGNWSEVTWHVETNDAPFIKTFELAHDTGLTANTYETLDRVTSDPTLVGQVTDPDGTVHAFVAVEFDHNGDGTIDGTTVADADGNFRYTPQGLSAGHWDIVARVQEYNPVVADTLTHEYFTGDGGWAHITAKGDPSDTSGAFAGFTLVKPSAATVTQLSQPDNPNGSGSGYDPTLIGEISDPDTYANVTIDFYRDPNGENEFLGSTNVDRDGKFSFTPVGLAFGTNIAIKAVPKELNYLTGATLEGTELEISGSSGITFSAKSDFTVAIPTLSQSDDFFTLVSASTVTVPLDTNNNYETVAPQYIEVSVLDSNDTVVHRGIAEIEFSAPTDSTSAPEYRYTYEYDLREDNLPAVGTVTVKVRPVGVDEHGLVFGAESTATNHSYEFPVVELDNAENSPTLLTGSDVVGNDGTLLRPSLSGNVNLAFADTNYSSNHEIEVDYDGDGLADATVFLEDGETDFEYEFEGLEPGDVSLFARAITTLEKTSAAEGEENIQRIEGEWQPIEFTLASTAPTILPEDHADDNLKLRLANPREGEDLVSSDPTITGTVNTLLMIDGEAVSVGGMTVEIDHNSDGVADGTATVLSDGLFEYTPTGLPVGEVTLLLRAIDYYSDTQPLVGEWVPFNFTLAATNAPTITSLVLEQAEGTIAESQSSSTYLPVSRDPVITGTVETTEGVGQIVVEFDHDGDGLADGSAEAHLFGAFSYTPENLPHGNLTVLTRTLLVNGAERVIGDWSAQGAAESLTFHHLSAEPAVITDLAVEDAERGIITGRATVGGYGQAIQIEIALGVDAANGDEPIHNGFAYADSNGIFRYQMHQLPAAPDHTIHVRGIFANPNGPGDVTGDWQELTDALDNSTATYVALQLNDSEVTFDLKYDTGTNVDATADPTLTGTVPVSSLDLPIRAEIKLAGASDTSADKVRIRPDGTFTFTPLDKTDPDNPKPLANGTYEYVVRFVQWDPQNGTEEETLWAATGTDLESVSFTLDETDNTAAWVTELRLRNNTAPSGSTEQSAEPIFVGTIDNDGRKSGLTIEFDHNGDGVVDGTTLTREDGSFQYTAVGLEPGTLTQTITAIVRETDYFGNERTSTIASLDFILTLAPLVKDLEYKPNVGVDNGFIETNLHYPTSQSNPVLEVEYELFGVPFGTPPIHENWQWGDYQASADIETATLNSSTGKYEIDLPDDVSGAGSALVRGVDRTSAGNPIYGPWQIIHFELTQGATTAPTLAAFALAHDNGDLQDGDPLVRDPSFTGTLSSQTYGVVEIEVSELTSEGGGPEVAELVGTHRVTADAEGNFTFHPNLPAAGKYTFEAYSVVFDFQTGAETDGAAVSETFHYTIESEFAKVTLDPQVTGATHFTGTVSNDSVNASGRVSGLQVEFAILSGGEYVTIGSTFSRAGGSFSFAPQDQPGIVTGQAVEIYARVLKWNPDTQGYAGPDFGDAAGLPTADADKVSFTLPDTIPNSPDLEGDDSLANKYVREALRDLVSWTIDELHTSNSNLYIKGSTDGSLDLGFGDALLVAEPDADGNVEVPLVIDSSISTWQYYNDSDTLTGTLSHSSGENIDYVLEKTISDLVNNEYTITVNLSLTLDDDAYNNFEYAIAETETDNGSKVDVTLLGGTYGFTFSGTVDASGTTYSGDYSYLSEDADLEYLVQEDFTPTDTSDQPLTTTGWHNTSNFGDNGTIAVGVAAHTASNTETNRYDEHRNDVEVVTSTSGNQTITVTTTTIETVTFVETITRTGLIDSSGSITTLQQEVYDANANVDSQVTVKTVTETIYDATPGSIALGSDNWENSSDTFTTGLLYTGTLFATTDYTSGSESTNFEFQEGTHLTSKFYGGGSAGNGSRSESWNFAGHGFARSSSLLGGTAEVLGTGTDTTTRLDAGGFADTFFEQEAHGGGSFNLGGSSDSDNSVSGGGGGTFRQSSHGSSFRSASIAAVDEVFRMEGFGHGGGGGHSSSSSNASIRTKSKSESDTGSVTTDLTTRSRGFSSATFDAGGKYDFVNTDQSQTITGDFHTGIILDAGGGSLTTGTIRVEETGEPTYTVPVNNGGSSRYGLVVTNRGDYRIRTGVDSSSNQTRISGTVKRTETTGSRGSSFSGTAGPIEPPGDDGEPTPRYLPVGSSSFSFSKTTRDVVNREEYDYSTTDSGTTRRGTFENDDHSTSETLDQFQFSDENLTYNYRSDSGGESTTNTDGPFSESASGRTAQLHSDQKQQGHSSTESDYTYETSDTSGRSYSRGYSSRGGSSDSKGDGSASIKNDEVTQNGGSGEFKGDGRVKSGGTSFSETFGDGTYSSRFSTGDSRGSAGGDSKTTSAGGGHESGSANANSNSNSDGRGNSVDRSVSTDANGVTTKSETISRGKSGGNSKGSSSGSITPGPDTFNVDSEQGGGGEGRTTTTNRQIGPNHSRFTETTGTSKTGGKNSFGGEVSDRGEEGDVEIKSDNDFGQYLKERENFNSDGFRSWHTGDGERTQGTDLTAKGRVDHDAVPVPNVSITFDAGGKTITLGGNYNYNAINNESTLNTYQRTLDHDLEAPSDTLLLGKYQNSRNGDDWRTYTRTSKSTQRTNYSEDKTTDFEGVDTYVDSTNFDKTPEGSITTTLDNEENWTRAFEVEGNRRTLTIKDTANYKETVEGNEGPTDLSVPHPLFGVATVPFTVEVDQWKRVTTKEKKASYRASHTVTAAGLIKGGSLKASSKITHDITESGTGEDPMPDPGPVPDYPEQHFTEGKKRSLSYSVSSSVESSENSGYYDVLNRYGQPERRIEGTSKHTTKSTQTASPGDNFDKTNRQNWATDGEGPWYKDGSGTTTITLNYSVEQKRTVENRFGGENPGKKVLDNSLTLLVEGKGITKSSSGGPDGNIQHMDQTQKKDGSGVINVWYEDILDGVVTRTEELPIEYTAASEIGEIKAQRAAANRKTLTYSSVPQQTPAAAFFSTLASGAVDLATDEIPIISQAKALEKIFLGRNSVTGEENLSWWERSLAVVELFPGGSSARRGVEGATAVADVVKGANRAADASKGLGRAQQAVKAGDGAVGRVARQADNKIDDLAIQPDYQGTFVRPDIDPVCFIAGTPILKHGLPRVELIASVEPEQQEQAGDSHFTAWATTIALVGWAVGHSLQPSRKKTDELIACLEGDPVYR